MNKKLFTFLVSGALLLTACTSAIQAAEDISPGQHNRPSESIPSDQLTDNAEEIEFLPPETAPLFAEDEFTTDFSKHTVSYTDILSGGPPKDGIRALDQPSFISVSTADSWLRPNEPVIAVVAGDTAKAYPIQVLVWHEIVNDTIGDLPLTITFCPLCNTGIAFEREFEGNLLDFGTTGRLRFSNLIMYDRQTETWWQQATGEGIAGVFAGRQLAFYPAAMVSWEEFQSSFPNGQVLSKDTGFNRNYGSNPYPGYDDINGSPGLFRGPATPGKLPAMARVLTVDLENEAVAYPFDLLDEAGVVNDTVDGKDTVVFWQSGTESAFDSSNTSLIPQSLGNVEWEAEVVEALNEPGSSTAADVGAANVFERMIDGQVLTFFWDGEIFRDEQTDSTWNILGHALDGPLTGSQLKPVVAINHFWFSWAAFKPETRIYQP